MGNRLPGPGPSRLESCGPSRIPATPRRPARDLPPTPQPPHRPLAQGSRPGDAVLARLAISRSVTPAATYSSAALPERLTSGSTTMARGSTWTGPSERSICRRPGSRRGSPSTKPRCSASSPTSVGGLPDSGAQLDFRVHLRGTFDSDTNDVPFPFNSAVIASSDLRASDGSHFRRLATTWVRLHRSQCRPGRDHRQCLRQLNRAPMRRVIGARNGRTHRQAPPAHHCCLDPSVRRRPSETP